jgi:hypothetical protein
MPFRYPLGNITNKGKQKKSKYSAFREDASAPLTMDETVDFCLDLSPIKASEYGDVLTPKANHFSKLSYPPDCSPVAFNYRKVLNDFPTIYSDENYIDPEVVNSYIDYCAQLKEISDPKLVSLEPSPDYKQPEIDYNANAAASPSSHADPLPMLKVKDVRFGKNWLKKVWVRKEKSPLPKTGKEDFL